MNGTHISALKNHPKATVLVFNEFHFFNPYRWYRRWRFGEEKLTPDHGIFYRTHRKIVVVDDKVGFCGGMNIAQEYAGDKLGTHKFHDSMVRVEGPCVEFLSDVFMESVKEAAPTFPPPKWRSWVRQKVVSGYNRVFQLLTHPTYAIAAVKELKQKFQPSSISSIRKAPSSVSRYARIKTSLRSTMKKTAQLLKKVHVPRRARKVDATSAIVDVAATKSNWHHRKDRVSSGLRALGRRARAGFQKISLRRRGFIPLSKTTQPSSNAVAPASTSTMTNADQSPQSPSYAYQFSSASSSSSSNQTPSSSPASTSASVPVSAPVTCSSSSLSSSSSSPSTSSSSPSSSDSNMGVDPMALEIGIRRDSVMRGDSSYRTRNHVHAHAHEDTMKEGVFTQVVRSNVLRRAPHIEFVYAEAISAAVKSIILTTPFFIPTKKLGEALILAADRGVNVTIITQGKSDTPYMRWAAQYSYEKYLEHNIRIFEYNERVLHAKTMTADGFFSCFGSSNLDFFSYTSLLEVLLTVVDRSVAKQLHKQADCDMKNCAEITMETVRQRSIVQRMWSAMWHFIADIARQRLINSYYKLRHFATRNISRLRRRLPTLRRRGGGKQQ
eukprot:TRINITY_DN2331_c0_g1_i1.p1 TRINITY_DN2331_c0_g1~~TRINITY_DN2331_c0_g1_i1.p1  ORF type:complete len:640 (-),score=162.84 TRINITY_DN2331_c0_g1_i1:143-1969(-)